MKNEPGSILRGHIALVAVQFVFGLFPLFIHWAAEDFTPRAIVFWRILAGATVFGLLAAREGRAALPRRADLGRLFACSVLAVTVNQMLATEGIARTTSTNAGLIMPLIPVFTYGLAAAVRQEAFRAHRALGIAIAMAGVLVLVLDRSGPADLSQRHMSGNMMVVGNCLAYAAFLVLARPLLMRYSPAVLLAWVYVLALWSLPVIGWGQDLMPEDPGRLALIGVGYAVLFGSILGHFLNAYALARVSASTTAIYVSLQPLIAGAAGVALLDEELSGLVFVAAALLFVGIGLVNRRPAVIGS